MRHAIAAALVAVLVVSAGCGGTTGGETPTGATTTGGTTTDATATATPTRTPIAASGFPGVDGTAVDETALVAAHDRALSNGSYTLSLEQRIGETDIRVDVRREGNEELLTTTVNGTAETDYTNGSTEYIRTEEGNGSVTYRNQSVDDFDPYTGEVVVDDFVNSADHRPVAVTTHDGVEVVELTAGRADVKPDALVENTTVETFESRLLVDRDGRIRLFEYRIAGVTRGERFDFRLRFRVADVGSTTVERPDWVSRA